MYRSPIEVFHNIAQKADNGIYSAVIEQGVNVDREELIKALRYDRNQYEKGYQDGLNDRPQGEWINCNAGNATCSRCGTRQKAVYDDDNEQHFCGHCGARMGGAANE